MRLPLSPSQGQAPPFSLGDQPPTLGAGGDGLHAIPREPIPGKGGEASAATGSVVGQIAPTVYMRKRDRMPIWGFSLGHEDDNPLRA